MRPVIEKNKFEPRHVAYIIIIVICVIAIGAGVYMQFYQDEKCYKFKLIWWTRKVL